MRKFTFIILTVLTLTACGSTPNSADPASGSQGGIAGELPATTQLIVGTFKLENTGQAVTADQAAELLPLWQTMQVLSESDSAAEQETEALIAQIQETMTAGQMQAITDMNLTREDMMTIMQKEGMAMGVGPANQSSTSQGGNSSSNNSQGVRPGGGMSPPNGEFPGNGPGMGPGGQVQNLSPDQIATAQASRQQGSDSFVPRGLMNALIEYLQQKAGS